MSVSKTTELIHAELAIAVIIILQATLAPELVVGWRPLVVCLEAILAIGIWFAAFSRHHLSSWLRQVSSLGLIALVTLTNISSLLLVINALVSGSSLNSRSLIYAALAIFLTNIILFGLWYWELDSPGLSGVRPTANRHFWFTQDANPAARPDHWRPSFFDYLYLSTTNGTAFSPTDTLPLTHSAKALMGVQALVSLLTLALVAARAVNIFR